MSKAVLALSKSTRIESCNLGSCRRFGKILSGQCIDKTAAMLGSQALGQSWVHVRPRERDLDMVKRRIHCCCV
jgi:hypothetical protein